MDGRSIFRARSARYVVRKLLPRAGEGGAKRRMRVLPEPVDGAIEIFASSRTLTPALSRKRERELNRRGGSGSPRTTGSPASLPAG